MSRIVPADAAGIARASRHLRAAGLVAFPTETVYGLGGIATDAGAIRSIYRAKGRPAHNPLIIHVADLAAALELARFDARARRVAEAFWPGPLTLVLPRREPSPLHTEAMAGLPSVALRIPAHPVAQALLAATALPVAAPSANPSGRVSSTTAAHVAQDLGDAVELVLDAGPSRIGVESTVLDLAGAGPARLLRPGGLPIEILRELVGDIVPGADQEARPISPGQLASHYAPLLPVRLNARTVAGDEALLAFGEPVPQGAHAIRNLSPRGDLEEAARNLFTMLRELDLSGAARIACMAVPDEGLGAAINDRLRRAAAPRLPA